MAGRAVVVDETEVPVGESFRIWTQNLSRNGAWLISERAISLTAQVFFKLYSPEFSQKLALCEVVRDGTHEQQTFNRTRTVHAYGVRVLQIVSEAEVPEETVAALSHAAPLRPPSTVKNPSSLVEASTDLKTTPIPAAQDLTQRESLVPFLSACGLIVVHLSRFTW